MIYLYPKPNNILFEFKFRSSEPEILDDFDLHGNDLTENLRELEKVNQLLGGYSVVKEGIEWLLSFEKAKGTTLIDAGCGGGDTLRELLAWSRHKAYKFQLIGVDANQEGIAYCKSVSPAEIQFLNINIFASKKNSRF